MLLESAKTIFLSQKEVRKIYLGTQVVFELPDMIVDIDLLTEAVEDDLLFRIDLLVEN